MLFLPQSIGQPTQKIKGCAGQKIEDVTAKIGWLKLLIRQKDAEIYPNQDAA